MFSLALCARLRLLCAIHLDLAQTTGKVSQINAADSEISPVLCTISAGYEAAHVDP